jgi:hypothetical protein
MAVRLPVFVILAALHLAAQPAWVKKSDEHAQVLLNVMAKFSPEVAAQRGVSGVDEQVADLAPGFTIRAMEAYKAAEAELRRRHARERDPIVKQDLEILLEAAGESIRGAEIAENRLSGYINVTSLAFNGLRALLDQQVAPERRPAALVRMRKYRDVIGHAERRVRTRLENSALLAPYKPQVEQDLANAGLFIDGIGKLFTKFQIAGYEKDYAALREQLLAYNRFVREEVLPRARTDFRLPPDIYAFRLEQTGIDIPAADLAALAHAAFNTLQAEMQKVAGDRNYRDVLRDLKKDQLVGDAILDHYVKRNAEIEAIIRREGLVSLPERPARIRIATPAESAASPAPHMRPPPLLNNRGESGEFVLPLNIPSLEGKLQQFDDFTFAAASWTLCAHELRPGHEMQYASMVEKGVSAARAIFAFNSTNVEGWGLYSEWLMFPYMPREGQLVSLQHRMMRAARAFLDPELQMGKVTPEEAFRILTEDVGLSDAMARQEVERYTFRSPGQATAYFYGYTRLRELRADVEKKLGSTFEPRKFHDFVLAQGLLPPQMLRNAVMTEFVSESQPRR